MRVALIQIGLFLLPFGLYALWLILRSQSVFTGRSWRPLDIAILTVLGLTLSLVLFTLGWQYGGAQLSGRNAPPPPAAVPSGP